RAFHVTGVQTCALPISRPYQVGYGWKGFDLYAAGDLTGDGRNDIVSIDSAGRLWFYAARGGGYFRGKVQAGYGWKGYEFASGAEIGRASCRERECRAVA